MKRGSKRILSALIAMLMVIGMSGCGESVSGEASEVRPSEVTQSSASSTTESSYVAESSITTEESVSEEESSVAEPDEKKEEAEVAETPSEALPTDSESVDDYSGIIMCAPWIYPNGSQYIIFSLNPDTGEYAEISRLSYWQEDGKYYYSQPLLSYYTNYRSKFDADFTKVAATYVVYGTKESHAGWVDANGVFFDVPKAAGMGAENEFVAQPDYYSIGFTDDGRFVFAEVTDCEEKIDSDNIEKYATFYYVFLDNPSAVYEGNPLAEEANHGKTISEELTCWINEDEYLANYRNDQTVIRRASDPSYMEEYISGEVRRNWGGIVGPDGTFAFVSMPEKVRYDMGIYVTQRDGSGLERIFTCDDLFEYAGNRTANFYRMQLISWQ